jgi:hypothetical protein
MTEDHGDFGTGLVAFLLALTVVLGFFFLTQLLPGAH